MYVKGFYVRKQHEFDDFSQKDITKFPAWKALIIVIF